MEIMYLVTGATGNLGSRIVNELSAAGRKIRAFVLPGDKAVHRLPVGVEIFEGNILDRNDLRNFFNVPGGTQIVVIHSAGIVSIVWNYVNSIYEVNVLGTKNVVEQCIEARVKKLVYISSVHAIPELPAGQTIVEVKKFDPGRIIGFYGKTKAEASRSVMEAVEKHGLNATLIFPTGLCGPYDYAGGYVSQLLVDCAKNRLPAGIEGGYDFADVRDVARGIVSACDSGGCGEGYILGNRYVPVAEILRLVHEQTGARLVKHMLPQWAAYMLLPYFSIYYKLGKRPPIFTRYSLYTIKSNSSFSSDKAKMELGYKVRPFEQTIADELTWLKSVGRL